MSKSVKEWLAKRSAHINAINKMKIAIDENIDCYSLFELDERAKKLQSDFQKFEARNLDIMCAEKSSDFDEGKFDIENDVTNNLCLDLKAKIKEKMAEIDNKNKLANTGIEQGDSIENLAMSSEHKEANLVDKSAKAQANESEHNKLKNDFKALSLEMDIMKFTCDDWHLFEKDCKEKIEGSTTLSDDDKMKMLVKACAQTKAESILVRLVDSNYESALAKLRENFGTAYSQVNWYWNKLLNIPKLDEKVPTAYTSMVNSIDHCMAGLSRHLAEEKFVHLIPFVAINKLGDDIRLDWERYRKVLVTSYEQSNASTGAKGTYVPDWQAIKVFLQDEADLYWQYGNQPSGECVDEATGDIKSMQATQNNNVASVKMLSKTKPGESKAKKFCNCTVWHPIHKCPLFLDMNINGREEYIRKHKICGQCLLDEHMGKPCEDNQANRFCQRCLPEKVKHNSILCIVSYRKANNLAVVTPLNSQSAWKPSDDWD